MKDVLHSEPHQYATVKLWVAEGLRGIQFYQMGLRFLPAAQKERQTKKAGASSKAVIEESQGVIGSAVASHKDTRAWSTASGFLSTSYRQFPATRSRQAVNALSSFSQFWATSG